MYKDIETRVSFTTTTIIDSYKGFTQRLEWSGGRQEDDI